MRLRRPPRTRTYLRALSLRINPVDLGTFGCVADSLQDGSLSCICSADYQNSELVIRDLGLIRLGSHGSKSLQEGRLAAKVLNRCAVSELKYDTIQPELEFSSLG